MREPNMGRHPMASEFISECKAVFGIYPSDGKREKNSKSTTITVCYSKKLPITGQVNFPGSLGWLYLKMNGPSAQSKWEVSYCSSFAWTNQVDPLFTAKSSELKTCISLFRSWVSDATSTMKMLEGLVR